MDKGVRVLLTTQDATDGQATLRRANLRRALQLIFANPGEQTRAGIARATGLTAATASSLVAELIEERIVAEGSRAASTGGKRATTLTVDASHHLLLAVVIRPTDALAALVALDGGTVYEERIAFAAADRERVLQDMLTRISGRFGSRLLAACVQVPGATDGRVVLESVQLDLTDRPLASEYEGILGVPVRLMNDVDAEAVAEAAVSGDGQILFIHLGTGIGASLTQDGDIAPGPRLRGGEIGHVQVVFGEAGRACRCGRFGCLEAESSMSAMVGAEFSEAMTAAESVALIERTDQEAIDRGATALARAIKLLAAMLDPTEIVLGGSARLLGERFLDKVRAAADYPSRGTVDVPIRYDGPHVLPYAGAAQAALSAALGVHWTPGTLSSGGAR
ncbi:MAG: ROK family protein [Actinobacteria bacterium]|nr:ROK family protein [Actinomycetota bacterium]